MQRNKLYTKNIDFSCGAFYPAGMASKRGPKNSISDQHKAAMAEGRVEGKVVRDYLDALRNSKGKPGRKRTVDSVSRRLASIEVELSDASPVRELELVQERMDLQLELEAMKSKVDPATLESGFVKVAASYSSRKGISYSAWRAVGVEPAVLKRAGISRGS
ncbi:MAG: hypothetical protein RI900_2383 [Actinomycetota bacterium]